MKISHDIRYIGVNDHKIDLFEGQYAVPNGMSYNSYVIVDEKSLCWTRWTRVFCMNGWTTSRVS